MKILHSNFINLKDYSEKERKKYIKTPAEIIIGFD